MGSRMMDLWDLGFIYTLGQIPHCAKQTGRILTTGLDCSDHVCSCLFNLMELTRLPSFSLYFILSSACSKAFYGLF